MQVCKLCLHEDELQLSHIYSKFIYKFLRDPRDKSAPVKVTQHCAVQVHKQLKEPMLCKGCEHRFGLKETIVQKLLGAREYKIHESNIDDFKYFALSLLWRDANQSQSKSKINLGKYGEEIRSYLLNLNPPKGVVVHTGFGSFDANQGFLIPAYLVSKKEGFHHYRIVVLNLKFEIFIGNNVTTEFEIVKLSFPEWSEFLNPLKNRCKTCRGS